MKDLPASPPMSSARTATENEIIALMNALSLNYHRPMMSEGQLRVWLRTFCLDLAGRSRDELENACTRYRTDGTNRFMATSGQILDLCRDGARHAPRSKGRIVDGVFQPWGGGCQCKRCREKTPSEGFYRASPAEHARDAQTRKELDAHLAYQIEQMPRVNPGESMAAWRERTGMRKPDNEQ